MKTSNPLGAGHLVTTFHYAPCSYFPKPWSSPHVYQGLWHSDGLFATMCLANFNSMQTTPSNNLSSHFPIPSVPWTSTAQPLLPHTTDPSYQHHPSLLFWILKLLAVPSLSSHFSQHLIFSSPIIGSHQDHRNFYSPFPLYLSRLSCHLFTLFSLLTTFIWFSFPPGSSVTWSISHLLSL